MPDPNNPVWILPSHAPNTSPPYKYYPSAIGGPIDLTLFIFFKNPLGSAVTVALHSDEVVFAEVPGGQTMVNMTEQHKAFSLTCPGIAPAADGSRKSLPVALAVTEPNGQKSKVIVQLYSHPAP